MSRLRHLAAHAFTVAAAMFVNHAAAAQGSAAADALSKIGHIVVIFEENRSFDNIFGAFPGANGLENAGATARQVNLDGTPYEFLPPVIDTNAKPPAVDPRFPAQLPNAPFRIDRYVP